MTSQTSTEPTDQRRHREITGTVVSAAMNKTRVIETKRRVRHGLYHKSLIRKSRIFVHDEKNESKQGDTVLARETRPLSRNTKFKLVSILTKGTPKP